MENQTEFPNRRPSKEIRNLHHNEIASAGLPPVNEEEDLSSPDERRAMHRSAFPSAKDSPLSSENNSPLKQTHNVSAFSPDHPSKERGGSWAHPEQKPEWAFEEEELPNFPTDTNSLRVLVVTWNLYGKKPKDGLEKLFNTEKVKHHIISIGTEECLRSIPVSTLYESKSYWVNMLRKHLEKDYIMLKSHSMNALHLTVFAHRSIFGIVRGIESAEVRTGLGNILGNKGGIGITIKLCDTSFLFINCHLASGQKNTRQRNNDFERILNELELPKERIAQEKKMKQKSNITDRFDYVFWSGDFNYRVNQTRENTIEFIKDNKFETLLKDDQMTITKEHGSTFNSFKEGEIKFPPTYKYQVNSNLFDSKKKRTPSWTDRILYRNRLENKTLEQLNYQSLPSVRISDHRPVFSQFVATIEGMTAPVDDAALVKVKTKQCNMF